MPYLLTLFFASIGTGDKVQCNDELAEVNRERPNCGTTEEFSGRTAAGWIMTRCQLCRVSICSWHVLAPV